MNKKNKPTEEFYKLLQKLYNFYNLKLFGGELEDIMFAVTRKKKSMGYFTPNSWKSKSKDKVIGELSLNPVYFRDENIEITLSHLVHEMCHVWQFQYGFFSKQVYKGYHNKEWSKKMQSIGLVPSDTGEVNGKKTGYWLSHYIDENGMFKKQTKKLFDSIGFDAMWHGSVVKEAKEAELKDVDENKPKSDKKIKYSCGCSNVWGKPGLYIICGEEDCKNEFLPITKEKQQDK